MTQPISVSVLDFGGGDVSVPVCFGDPVLVEDWGRPAVPSAAVVGPRKQAVWLRFQGEVVGKMLNLTKEQVLADLDQGTWLKASPHTEDTANGAVLLASDLARKMTGTVHNATAGVCTD